MRIGYLVPEFPGQTHAFFWRELRMLEKDGVQPEVVSTRSPPQKLIAHAWTDEARKRTRYLYPPSVRMLLGGLAVFLLAGPRRWFRCLRLVLGGEGGFGAKLRLIPPLVFGTQLAWLARSRGWRHLHVHSCATSAQIAAFASALSGLSYSLTLHGPLRDYGLNQPQKWRAASFALVITERLRQEVVSALSGSLPPVIRVAPMGVDVSRFCRTSPYHPWVGEGEAIVFSCGRLNPCKGMDVLIRAVGQLRDQGFPIHLRIAGEDDGDGSYRKHLENLIADLGLGGRVHLLGAVSEEVVRGEIECAHVFALASVEEPLGVAIMEAMSMQVPVVVTGAGGVPELVEDGVDGALVPPRDAEQLAAALARVLRDPVLARRLSEAARHKIETAFHSGRSAEMLGACLSFLAQAPLSASKK